MMNGRESSVSVAGRHKTLSAGFNLMMHLFVSGTALLAAGRAE
jgi:hypothetical protein